MKRVKSQTISSKSVEKATGKSWDVWFTLLEKMKARDMTHKDIARKLGDEYGVDGWWAQNITVEFERMIGRREIGQTRDSNYQTGASKTLGGTMDDVLKAWQKLVGNARDFNGVTFSAEPGITKTDRWRYWRVNLTDGTKITVAISNKGSGKSHLAISHEKLPDAEAFERWKLYWKDYLCGLKNERHEQKTENLQSRS